MVDLDTRLIHYYGGWPGVFVDFVSLARRNFVQGIAMSPAELEVPHVPDGVTGLRLFTYQASENLVDILDQVGGSLLISTYQAGRVVAVGVSQGSLNVTLHTYERAMGLAVAHDRVAVGSGPQIFFLQSMPEIARLLEPPGKFDSCFVTRSSHLTGEIHSHELAFGGQQLWFVNTLFSCLCVLHPKLSFLPRWKPPFISAVTSEDRCHLNGLAMADGQPVTSHPWARPTWPRVGGPAKPAEGA